MEQEIILEGIHALLEEIRDNMKKNPELETIKSKLNAIEKACNEFTGQKFITEDVLAQFLVCTLQKIAEMNQKQDEKIRGYVSKHHKCISEQMYTQHIKIDMALGKVKDHLEKKKVNLDYYGKLRVYINKIFS